MRAESPTQLTRPKMVKNRDGCTNSDFGRQLGPIPPGIPGRKSLRDGMLRNVYHSVGLTIPHSTYV